MANLKKTQKPVMDLLQPFGLPNGVRLLRISEGHQGYLTNLAYDKTGQFLASSAIDGTARLWDAISGAPLRVLEGHENWVRSVAFDPSGYTIATGSDDLTIKLWDIDSGKVVKTLKGHETRVFSVMFSNCGRVLASGSDDRTVRLWDPQSGKTLHVLDHSHWVYSVAFSPSGQTLATGSHDGTVMLWDILNLDKRVPTSKKLLGHSDRVWCVAFDPQSRFLASGSRDRTVKIWNFSDGSLIETLEEHTGGVQSIAFSYDGMILASKGRDGKVLLWSCDTWKLLGTIREETQPEAWLPGLAFHPSTNLLATGGPLLNDLNCAPDKQGKTVHFWDIDISALLKKKRHRKEVTDHRYINAKAVLLGDSGVGKTALARVLCHMPYEATESTAGRRLWKLDRREVSDDAQVETREVLLWDLAGQHGYRLIHQLHMQEVTVAIIALDAKSELDPFGGIRYWDRALRAARERDVDPQLPLKKFLVSCRNDRGGIAASDERLRELVSQFGFDGYFRTSAKEGWEVEDLRSAILEGIDWTKLPSVASSELFGRIYSLISFMANGERLIVQIAELTEAFSSLHPTARKAINDFPEQVELCLSRLENRNLIRRMSFGDYVLLKPELLDAYVSAIVQAAKQEPDGLGSILEHLVLSGKFFVPKEHKVGDPKEEEMLIHAAVQELLRHDLAFREPAANGVYLVFPSEFSRDYTEADEPEAKSLMITFEGPVQNIYSTLTVRLVHSSVFSCGRAKMWKNASQFSASVGGVCGIHLHEYSEGRGKLTTFYLEDPSSELRALFEQFIIAHVQAHAVRGSLRTSWTISCEACGTEVPPQYVQMLVDKKADIFNCPCGATVSILNLQWQPCLGAEVISGGRGNGEVEEETSGECVRASCDGENLEDWVGGNRAVLAIASTALACQRQNGDEINGLTMTELRIEYFARTDSLLDKHGGRLVGVVGDVIISVFRNSSEGLCFLMELKEDARQLGVLNRSALHVGPVSVKKRYIMGETLEACNELLKRGRSGTISVSSRAKADVESGRRVNKGIWADSETGEFSFESDSVKFWII